MPEINIMPCRYEALEYIIAATNKIPFIGYDGKNLISAGVSDDLGIYYFIPLIKHMLNISLDQSIAVFFNGIVFSAFLLGLIGFFLIYKSMFARVLAFVGLFSLSILSLNIGDVYIAYSASSIAIIPLALYCFKRSMFEYQLIIYFLIGLMIGFFHIIRCFSSLGPLLFVLILLLTCSLQTLNKRLILLALIICSMLIFPIYFKILYAQYDNFASKHLSTYQEITDKHIFWHSVYIGFGFLNNNLGIKYDDKIGANKAISIDPTAIYPSMRYEQVIKEEVFKLFKTQKQFVLSTIFAKIGTLFFILFSSGRYVNSKWKNILTLFLNLLFIFGIGLLFFYSKSWKIDIAYLIAILFNSLFGIIIMPEMSYLLGFVVCTTLFCLTNITSAFEQGFIRDIYNLYLNIKSKKITLIKNT